MDIRNAFIRVGLVVAMLSATSYAGEASLLAPAASIEMPDSKGKFDFLRIDVKRNRLLASHENDGTADYIDLKTNKLISRVKVGGAVDTAVDADSKLYYVSVQEAERVAILDAATLKEIKSVKTGGPTDAILWEPKRKMVYVTHDDGTDVWVIDPATASIVTTVRIPGTPEVMVYDADADRIYLNIKNKDLVAVIDPASNKVVAEWPTAPATRPHGIALDQANHRVFSAGANSKLAIIDTKTGASTGSADIVPGVDQIAYDPVGRVLYCAGPNNMSVLKVGADGQLTSFGKLTTGPTAKNVAVDPTTRNVWTTYTDGKSSFAKAWMPPKP